ncbi:hypothetical protein RB653_003781 [Dictyostelium firmibasis]|uniref:Cation/H+ exchanger transmembrane domain-containing protein n=1 Tax=Dictyostelium firmibasis TaxID=79012 RepID=A0AAN7UI31_9MYCE
MAEGVSIATGLNPLTDPVCLFIVQLLLIVVVSRLLGYLLNFVKQPPVISEVITGILLGPSVLSRSPAFGGNVFPAGTAITTLNVIANIGLIFFMFMIGLEVDASILKKNLKASMIISLSSIILPFAMGIGLAATLYQFMPFHKDSPTTPNFGLFCVFVGVAISITAFPVLARILNERNLMGSRVGVSSLAAASVDDVIAWILLAVVVSWGNNIKSGTDGVNLSALWTFLMLIGFLLFMGTVGRFGMDFIYKFFVKTEAQKHNMLVVILICTLVSAFFTQVIGVHSIFGAFVMGIITPRIDGFHIHVTERIEDFITIIMLPLYFTYSGLRTDLSSIDSGPAGGLTIFIIFIACLGKIGGATLASRFTKKSWRESLTIGFLMNTKGLVELIVLNIGLDIHVLDKTTFTMFVIMALVTTFMTTPIVHFIWTRWESKQNAIPMEQRVKGRFNILLYISNTRVGSALTNIAAAITPSDQEDKKKYRVRSLFLHPISDRPSSYFYSTSNNIKNLPTAKREAVEAIQADCEQVGLPFKPIFINSTDAAQDISSLAKKNQWPDIILLGYTRSETSNDGITSLSQSGSFGGEGQAFYGKVIVKVLQSCKSCVGVVVDKGLERFHRQHTILFGFSGEIYENDALTVVIKMARRNNIKVTVLATNPDKFFERINNNPKIEKENFTIVASNDPYREILEKSSNPDAEYWCVVVGVPREDATKQEKLINNTAVSLLLVHPSNTLLDPSLKSSSSYSNLNGLDYNKADDNYDTGSNIKCIDEEDPNGIPME